MYAHLAGLIRANHVTTEHWISVRKQLFPAPSLLWGPSEPSGDGWCTNLIFAEKWDFKWKGKGWRVNDTPCFLKQGFVCQKPKNTSGTDKIKNGQTNLVYATDLNGIFNWY